MATDSSDPFDPFDIEALKAEVILMLDQIETIREELFDYRKNLEPQSTLIPSMSHSDLLKMKDTLKLILSEALELKRIKSN